MMGAGEARTAPAELEAALARAAALTPAQLDCDERLAYLDDARRVEWRERVEVELRERGFHREADRFCECNTEKVKHCASCGHVRFGRWWCELSICPDCARRRAERTRQAWRNAAARVRQRRGFSWKLLTVTVEKSGDVRADYQRLRAAWRKFRHRLSRRYPGTGGFASVEVGESGNVHLHTLCYLPFVPKKCRRCEGDVLDTRARVSACCGAETICGLSPMWKQCSGAPVCDLRAVAGDPFVEACKYITKLAHRDPGEVVAIWQALRRFELWRPWGVAHGLVEKFEPAEPQCEVCGGIEWLTEETLKWLRWQEGTGPPGRPSWTHVAS